jgi:guanylate kinase
MEQKSLDQELLEQQARGVLLVITGPSGSGKDTLIAALKNKYPQLSWIISTTSRDLRDGESEGKPYHFVTRDRFEELIAQGAFFEWVEFRGELYGTQKQTLLDAVKEGRDIVWKIEAKGVKNIKAKIKQMVPRSAFVFLMANSMQAMKERVTKAEGEEGAKKRWNESLVIWEMKQYEDCEYLVVNKDGEMEDALQKLGSILEAKRLELER